MASVIPHIPGNASPRDMPLAQTIEVAVCFGDSVVGVKHILSPRAGKLGLVTRGLLLVGALLLVISVFAFAAGVDTASVNQARRRELAVQKSPREFRPRRLSEAFDWMALGGGVGALLCLSVGLARMRDERVEPTYQVGSGVHADFPFQTELTANLSLVAPAERGGFVLTFAPEWQGERVDGSERIPLSELEERGLARHSVSTPGALETPILADTKLRISTGQQVFHVHSVTRPRRQTLSLWAFLDSRFLAYLSGTTMTVLGLMLLFDTHFEDEMSLYLDAFADTERIRSVALKPYEPAIWKWEPVRTRTLGLPGGTGTRMAEAEGTMGQREATRATGRYAMKNHDAPPQLAREQALREARGAGILGLLKERQTGAFASITASADFSSGSDADDVYGGLIGNRVGEVEGGWGYGISGFGSGAGGTTGWGTIGAGRYGTIGHGAGSGSGYGSGRGNGGMRGRQSRSPRVAMCGGGGGCGSVVGDLDKQIIRRYIRRKILRIQHCYEKELLVHPDLAGTMQVNFHIAPNGTVQSVQASGFGNTKVESCVAAVIRSIQFPKPGNSTSSTSGPGYVQVRYPFTFSSPP